MAVGLIRELQLDCVVSLSMRVMVLVGFSMEHIPIEYYEVPETGIEKPFTSLIYIPEF